MIRFPKIFIIIPFTVIISCAAIIFGIRYLTDLQFYELHLTYAQPVIGLFYLWVFYYSLLVRKKNKLGDLGLRPGRTRFTASMIFGGLGGFFFFMVYFGAHPNRMFPTLTVFTCFNVYYLFFLFAEEFIFRIWAINFFTRVLALRWSILLSALLYTIAALATVGRDPSSVVSGEIDFFIIFETIFRSFIIGMILAGIYCLTKSIYGNIFFNLISTIPIIYEQDGPITKGNLISAIIATLCFLIFLIMVIRIYRKRASQQPVMIPAKENLTSRLTKQFR